MNHPFTEFPKHLHHGSKPAVIAHNKEEEAKARAEGYLDQYIHQEYPRYENGVIVEAPQSE